MIFLMQVNAIENYKNFEKNLSIKVEINIYRDGGAI